MEFVQMKGSFGQLSSGLWIDVCNPVMFYEEPPEEKIVVSNEPEKSLEERVIDLERKLSQNPPYEINDNHIMRG